MRTHLIIASVALVSCTEDSGRDVRTDDATAATATAHEPSGDAAPGTFRPTSMDASAGAPNTDPSSSTEWRQAYCDAPTAGLIPASPVNFRVELTDTACFGVCPVFSLTVDQDGQVTYYGEMFVARFGLQQKQVSPSDARAIYDALYQAGYNKLNRCYVDKVDGCQLRTDAPYSYWNVSGDGAAKAVDRYYGCENSTPELAQVDAVARVVVEKAGVSAWVPAWDPKRPPVAPAPMHPTAYRLSYAGKSLGTLSMVTAPEPAPRVDAGITLAENRWELVDCAKVPQASGTLSSQSSFDAESSFYVLLAGEAQYDPATRRITRQKLPIALPSLGDVGSILIDIPTTGGLQTAHAQRGDEDIPLELVADLPGC
jgi:hypothetical protein